MIFAIRHGERADFAGKHEQDKIELPIDPHLTDLGKVQAFQAGEVIKSLLKDSYDKELIPTMKLKYVIISSPFLRCIQTAFHIIQALKEENIYEKKIILEDSFGEHLSENYFKKSPLGDLYSRKFPEKLRELVDFPIQDGFMEQGKHIDTPKYPEDYYDSFEVRKKAYHFLKEQFYCKINREQNVVLVIVTHGYGIEAILEHHDALTDFDIKFTCLNQIMYEPNSPGHGVVLVKQYHEHLKKAGELFKK